MSGASCGYGQVSSSMINISHFASRALVMRSRADPPGSSYPVQLGASAQTVSLQAEHVRLCINSYALQTQSPEAGAALRKALDAAITIISAHNLSSQGDLSLSFAIDVSHYFLARFGLRLRQQYHIITVAQAALFLIRLTKATLPAQPNLYDLDNMTHFIETAISLLEAGDVSEIRFASFLARTVRGIAQAAGLIDGPPITAPVEISVAAPSANNVDAGDVQGEVSGQNQSQSASFAEVNGVPTYDDFDFNTWLPSFGTRDASGEFMGLGGGFDLEAFLQFGGDDLHSLNSLLALPTENAYQAPDQ